jgi:hypothetical protein
MESSKLDKLIERLYELANESDPGDEFAGSDGEYNYALGNYEAFSEAAHMVSQLKGK